MEKTKQKKELKTGFLHRTNMYGFELFMALFGLVATVIAIDYSLIFLFNFLGDNRNPSHTVNDFTIFVISAVIVWLPITLIFYLRSRAELEKNPSLSQSVVHKVLLSIYYFTLLFGGAILLFGAIFTLIRLAVTPDQPVIEQLLRFVVPALLAVGVHAGMMYAYPKSKRPNRKTFALIFGILTAGLSLVLFLLTANAIRMAKQDNTAINDLNAIESALVTYYGQHRALPESLQDLKITSQDVNGRLSRYTYKKVDTEKHELCATFATDTIARYNDIMPTPADNFMTKDGYMSYANFYQHPKGDFCFKIRTMNDAYYGKPISADPVME